MVLKIVSLSFPHPDMLIQYSNAQMAIEILYNAQNYTVKQCLRNLFQSFTAHKQIIYSGEFS